VAHAHRSPDGVTLKDVARLLKDHPHFKAPGASIDVLEFLSMPGMPQK